MMYQADDHRYEGMTYNRVGQSGLKLPMVSLGLWHNFGDITPLSVQQSMLRTAFDCGVTHFDLANNYGPPAGEAERNFGRLMLRDWRPYRDELVISTKAGHEMWPGPYGDHGSRKHLMASLDQSLQRMNLDYVDIFYHHRPDPETPMEETMTALKDIVSSGKALYIGVSKYSPEQTAQAVKLLNGMGVRPLIHQCKYNMMIRDAEDGLFDTLRREGMGCITFSPLFNGILTNRYLNGIPVDSRAAHDPRFLKPEALTDDLLSRVRALNDIAAQRGQSLAEMALSWVLRISEVSSVLIGASKPEQIVENCKIVHAPAFTQKELDAIDRLTLAGK